VASVGATPASQIEDPRDSVYPGQRNGATRTESQVGVLAIQGRRKPFEVESGDHDRLPCGQRLARGETLRPARSLIDLEPHVARRVQPLQVYFSRRLVQERHHREIVRYRAVELFGYGREEFLHRQLRNQGVGDLEQHPHPIAFPQERLPGEVTIHGDRHFRRDPLQKGQCFVVGLEGRRKSEPKYPEPAIAVRKRYEGQSVNAHFQSFLDHVARSGLFFFEW